MVGTLLRQWIRRLFPTGRPSRRPSSRVRPGFRPTLEMLETRLTPSVTFSTPQTFGVGSNPQAVAVADFNGDGRPDLVVVDKNVSGTVEVLLNTTAAGATAQTFASGQTFAVGSGPVAVAVGDFNGDGRPDLVVANQTAGTVSVLWNTTAPGAAAPTFATQETFAVGPNPVAVAVADLNGDGRPDIIVANNNVAGTVSVLLDTTTVGATSFSFGAAQTFAVGSHPVSVAVGDFNGDGRPDLVTANSGDGTASVLLNTTTGVTGASFAAAQTFTVGGAPSFVAVGDLNGDGRPDLVVANGSGASVSVLLDATATNAGAASFSTPTTFAVGNGPHSVAVADFSGDGRPDLVVVNSTDKTVSLLVNTAAAGATTPAFAGQQTFSAGAGAADVAAADFNGDDRPDFVVVDGVGSASALLNTTTPFATTTPVIVADFAGGGVWELNRVTESYVQLNSADASLLAADAQGDVVADFPHYGLWEYHPATGAWTQLNGVDAIALAVDAHGDVVASFRGYGVGEYLPSAGWRTLTPSAATLLAVNANGVIVGEFPGYGVWEYRPASGWSLLNGTDATAVTINGLGEVAVNFVGYGVAEYAPTGGWQLLNGTQALALAIDPYGDVTASFRGLGIAEYRPAYGWRGQSAASPSMLAMDANGDIFGEIPGYGIWEFDPYPGWYRLSGTDASLLAVA